MIFVAGLQLTGCKPSEATLKMNSIPNYRVEAGDHVLFLEFKIMRDAEGMEKVSINKSVAGTGRTKNLLAPVAGPYKILAVPRYSASRIEQEMSYEHPLFQSVEASDTTGTLTKSRLAVNEGALTIRLQDDPYLQKVDLYSVSPDKGKVLIYSLAFNR